MSERAPTVYYDGACPLCSAEIAFYRRRTGDVEFVDVSDPATPLPEGVTREAALARFHVRDGEGRMRSGADGFATLWRAVPGWGWLGRLEGVPGIRAVMEGAYRVFLRLRPGLVRLFVRLQRGRG